MREVVRTSSDNDLLPFLTEQDGVCSKCKKNGHISATCPNPQIVNIPDEFLKAFPKLKEAYEAAVAGGHFDGDLVKRWDYCLMALMRRKPEKGQAKGDTNQDSHQEDRPRGTCQT